MTKHQYERIMKMLLGLLFVLIGIFIVVLSWASTIVYISIPGFVVFVIGTCKSISAWAEKDYPGEAEDKAKKDDIKFY